MYALSSMFYESEDPYNSGSSPRYQLHKLVTSVNGGRFYKQCIVRGQEMHDGR